MDLYNDSKYTVVGSRSVFGFSQDEGETAEHVQRKSCVPRNLLQDCLPQIIRNPVIETSDDRFKIWVKIIDNRLFA